MSSVKPDEHVATTLYYDAAHAKQAVKILPGEYYVTSADMVLVTVLGSCVAAEAFSDVGHDRDRGSSKLVSKTKVASEDATATHLVDFDGQSPGLLPYLQLLEPRGLPGHRSRRIAYVLK